MWILTGNEQFGECARHNGHTDPEQYVIQRIFHSDTDTVVIHKRPTRSVRKSYFEQTRKRDARERNPPRVVDIGRAYGEFSLRAIIQEHEIPSVEPPLSEFHP